MNSIDHMLNGRGSRRHHQDIIRQVQQDKFAREAKAAQGNPRTASRLHTAMLLVINLLTQ